MFRIACCSVLMILGLACTALADPASVSVSGAGGVGMPTGSSNDRLQNGWSGEVRVGIVPDGSSLGMRADGFFGRQNAEAVAGTPTPHITTTGLIANAVWWFWRDLPVTPYVFGGFGFVTTDPSATFDGFPRSHTSLGLNAGGGFAHRYGPWGWFVEGRALSVRSASDMGTADPTDDSVNNTTVRALGGLTWWVK